MSDERPKPGPASPEVRRQKMKEMDASAIAEHRAERARAAPPAAEPDHTGFLMSLRDALNAHLPREITQAGKTPMSAVDAAQTGIDDANKANRNP